MIVLGIDPSLQTTGLATVEVGGVPGRERILCLGSVPTSTALSDAERIDAIVGFCVSWAGTVPGGVDLVGIETVFVGTNPQTALRLQALGGALRDRLRQAGYTMQDVHQSQRLRPLGVTKRQIVAVGVKQAAVDAVASRWGENCNEHEADAVGIALAAHGLWRRGQRPAGQGKLPLGRAKRSKRLPPNVLACMEPGDVPPT